MNKWESYRKRIMHKKFGRRIGRYNRNRLRSRQGAFMFRVSMEERREPWLNDRKKFYSNIPLRDFNLGRKRKGWTMTSVQENRKRYDGVLYWGEY